MCPAPEAVFKGTYHRARFKLLSPCKAASGVVRHITLEEDGDLHIQLELDAGQDALLNAKNKGLLVLELMPRDAGHLPKP